MNKLILVPAALFVFSAFAASPLEVKLKDAKGAEMGTATLTEMPNGVKIKIDAKGLTANGQHAVHIHDKGSCVGPKFDSAGPHFGVKNKNHGDVPGGPHEGDMPTLTADAKGNVSTEILNSHVKLGKGDTSLLKAGGTSIVIHAKRDDRKTQPSGDSGDRVLCGEIMEKIAK